MMKHKKIQHLLYDYLQGELEPKHRATVETHLDSCARCTDELNDLRSTLKIVTKPAGDPSDQRTPEFWANFAAQVENRLRQEDLHQTRPKPSLWETIESAVLVRPRFALAAGGALALIGIAALTWRLYTPATEEIRQPKIAPPPIENTSNRLNQYFRKSKTLLVGLSNLKATEGEPVDLSVEQRASRELLAETKSLRSTPLDDQSALLVSDLQKVLTEVADASNKGDPHNVGNLRAAIRRNNLLFKVRMAEAMHSSAYLMKARSESR